MAVATPPFIPQFGSGAPSAAAPQGTLYYDVSTVPFTPYVREAGAWHLAGPSGGGSNATSLQGEPISATTPTAGEVLSFDGSQWLAALLGPNLIVQDGTVSNTIQINNNTNLLYLNAASHATPTVTLPQTPTPGQLLIIIQNGSGGINPNFVIPSGYSVPAGLPVSAGSWHGEGTFLPLVFQDNTSKRWDRLFILAT